MSSYKFDEFIDEMNWMIKISITIMKEMKKKTNNKDTQST